MLAMRGRSMSRASGATGETFGQRLRAIILAQHGKLSAFADVIDMDGSQLSALVNDRFVERPKDATLAKLASRLEGVTAHDLDAWLPPRYDNGPAPPEDDPLASLQRKMALERPDVRAKLAQLKIKYADRPRLYEAMERRILRAWGTNIDGITDTALDDA
jgi:transcriptional regulator with XRE-family HTH domain